MATKEKIIEKWLTTYFIEKKDDRGDYWGMDTVVSNKKEMPQIIKELLISLGEIK